MDGQYERAFEHKGQRRWTELSKSHSHNPNAALEVRVFPLEQPPEFLFFFGGPESNDGSTPWTPRD